MVSIRRVQASNEALDGKTIPRTAVFIGATGGIGQSALTQLVTAAKGHGPSKIYVVGRGPEEKRQGSLLGPLRAANPEAELIWVPGQVALLADVKRICETIKAKESSVDLLYLSAGVVPWDTNDRKRRRCA
jgi:NAD(P)-dependent dehydrogenase (short-subunit alcohol dehydrogenase family)